MSFSHLGLAPAIQSSLPYTQATPIQQRAIPVLLQGRDLIASAQTGTGKTAAFTLPLLHRLSQVDAASSGSCRALVLTPTRELAAQVHKNIKLYGRNLSLRSCVVVGGVNMATQIRQLRSGVDVLVATPGRLMDLMRRGDIDLSRIEIAVLDEADQMLDMGFLPDIQDIMHSMPMERQSVFFTATISSQVKSLSSQWLRSPSFIELAPENATADSVTQKVCPVDQEKKRALLAYMIGQKNWSQVLVFCRTKHGADRLAKQLQDDGLRCVTIHGGKGQGARTRALREFKQGRVQVMVATDVAARGLDICALPVVINYNIPQAPEDYVHRIGRTGRAAETGLAITLLSPNEQHLLRAVEQFLDVEIQRDVWDEFAPNPNAFVKQTPGRSRKPRARKVPSSSRASCKTRPSQKEPRSRRQTPDTLDFANRANQRESQSNNRSSHKRSGMTPKTSSKGSHSSGRNSLQKSRRRNAGVSDGSDNNHFSGRVEPGGRRRQGATGASSGKRPEIQRRSSAKATQSFDLDTQERTSKRQGAAQQKTGGKRFARSDSTNQRHHASKSKFANGRGRSLSKTKAPAKGKHDSKQALPKQAESKRRFAKKKIGAGRGSHFSGSGAFAKVRRQKPSQRKER